MIAGSAARRTFVSAQPAAAFLAPNFPPLTDPFPGVREDLPPAKADLETGTVISKLSHGVTVAARAPVTNAVTVGVFANAGSRFENEATSGATHLLKYLAFQGTSHRSPFRVYNDLGSAKLEFVPCRETVGYLIHATQETLPAAFEVVADVIQHPRLADWQIEDAIVQLKAEDRNNGQTLKDLMYNAAFGYSGLGRPLASSPAAAKALTAGALRSFVSDLFRPSRIVVASAGVSQETLSALANKYFLPAKDDKTIAATPTEYLGGDRRQSIPRAPCNLMLAFPFAQSQAAAITVAGALLGNTTRKFMYPGQGLTSRLHAAAAGKFDANAIVSVHSDAALFAIRATAPAGAGGAAVQTIVSELKNLKKGSISDAALAAAKAQAKAQYAFDHESRTWAVTSAARQLLRHHAFEDQAKWFAKIDAVTAQAVGAAVSSAVSQAPALGVIGEISSVPSTKAITASLA